MGQFETWGYLGVVLGILSTGIPFVPIPEELPVVAGGVLVGHGSAVWWLMLPACIIAVIIGDWMLYAVGRFFGRRILENGWVKKQVLPPERLEKIEANFQKHGIKILLFARLTPGIRAPIFIAAGILRLPMGMFVLADGIYAIPGVSLLFFLGYWFTDSIINLIQHDIEHVKSIIMVVMILGVAGYFTYRFLRRPMVTGDPQDIPPVVEKMTHTLEQVSHKIEGVTGKILHPSKKPAAQETLKLPPHQASGAGQSTSGTSAAAQPTEEKKTDTV